MRYVGLDAHSGRSTLCVLDERGRKIRTRAIRGGWAVVVTELGKIRRPFPACFEASTGYGYLHDHFSRMARHVAVAHPGQPRLIFRSKRKNDGADAERLAKLLLPDEVPVVHVPSRAVRSWRRRITHRQKLGGIRILRRKSCTVSRLADLLGSDSTPAAFTRVGAERVRPDKQRGCGELRS